MARLLSIFAYLPLLLLVSIIALYVEPHEAFPGLSCANNSQCDFEGGSRCANNNVCCDYNVGLSCKSCEVGTGECLLNNCFDCVDPEVCFYYRDPSTGCCKEDVDAQTCFTYCNASGDCNELFEVGELCEIDEQCKTGNCQGSLNFALSYCCKPDVGLTCIACEEGTGNCISQNYLIFVLAALAILLLLTGVSCFISGRRMYDESGEGIDGYGRGAVRVLSPFDDDERTPAAEDNTVVAVEARVARESEIEEGKDEEPLQAEIIQRPSI